MYAAGFIDRCSACVMPAWATSPVRGGVGYKEASLFDSAIDLGEAVRAQERQPPPRARQGAWFKQDDARIRWPDSGCPVALSKPSRLAAKRQA